MVEPAEHRFVRVEPCLRAKRHIANRGGGLARTRVGPRPDHEALVAARDVGASVRTQAGKISQRACQQRVVPPGEMERRNLKAIVAGLDVGRIPECIGIRVREHLPIPRRKAVEVQLVERVERQLPQPLRPQQRRLARIETDRTIPIHLRSQDSPPDVNGLAQIPPEPVAQVERAALEHHVVAAAVGRSRKQRHQRWRLARGGLQLGGREVAATEHADAAVNLGQPRGPLHRIVAIVRLIVWTSDAVGGVSAARVLDHDHEAASRDGAESPCRVAIVLGVGRALQQRRVAAGGCRPVHVGAQNHAVAHASGYVLLDAGRRRRRACLDEALGRRRARLVRGAGGGERNRNHRGGHGREGCDGRRATKAQTQSAPSCTNLVSSGHPVHSTRC